MPITFRNFNHPAFNQLYVANQTCFLEIVKFDVIFLFTEPLAIDPKGPQKAKIR